MASDHSSMTSVHSTVTSPASSLLLEEVTGEISFPQYIYESATESTESNAFPISTEVLHSRIQTDQSSDLMTSSSASDSSTGSFILMAGLLSAFVFSLLLLIFIFISLAAVRQKRNATARRRDARLFIEITNFRKIEMETEDVEEGSSGLSSSSQMALQSSVENGAGGCFSENARCNSHSNTGIPNFRKPEFRACAVIEEVNEDPEEEGTQSSSPFQVPLQPSEEDFSPLATSATVAYGTSESQRNARCHSTEPPVQRHRRSTSESGTRMKVSCHVTHGGNIRVQTSRGQGTAAAATNEENRKSKSYSGDAGQHQNYYELIDGVLTLVPRDAED